MIASKEKIAFMCNICSSKASTKRTAERHHQIVHSGENPFQCDLCLRRFALKFLRDAHQETHNPKFMKCEVCRKDVRSVAMKTHIRKVHELQNQRKSVNCNICGKSVKNINVHLKIHENKLKKPSLIEKCPKCNKQYSFQEGKDLSMHMAKHELAKEYQCKDCQKYFATNSTLMTHTRLHTGEKPYSCQYCSVSFYDLGSKNIHEGRHSKKSFEKPPNKLTQSGNARYNTKKKIEKTICKVCRKTLQWSSMKKHLTTHTSVNTLACKFCQRKFQHRDSMKRHISIMHLKQKPYSCTICQKSYTLKFSLKDHEELHKGLQIKCEACEKMFPTQKLLATHDRLKHKPKVQNITVACKICKKTLFDSNSLTRHNLLVHSSNRPFSCKSCFKTFALRSMMNLHTRDTHMRRTIE